MLAFLAFSIVVNVRTLLIEESSLKRVINKGS